MAVSGVTVSGVTVSGVTVSGVTVSGVTVSGVTVSGVTVSGVTVSGVTVSGVTVRLAAAAVSRRNCGRATGRSSRPSTAVTIPASAAGTDRLPDRYRWVACPVPSGCGLVTRVSVVPNAADSAAIVPLTIMRRDPWCVSVTVSPSPVMVDVTRAMSSVSAPY